MDEQFKWQMEAAALGHHCRDVDCIECHVCRTLKRTVDELHGILAVQTAIGRRVRQLDEEDGGKNNRRLEDWVSLDAVDFEAEYRELEAMVGELKRVLLVDRNLPTTKNHPKKPGDRTEHEVMSTGVQLIK